MQVQKQQNHALRWRDGVLIAGIFAVMVALGFGVAFMGRRGVGDRGTVVRMAPNFVLRDQHGRQVSLAQYRGEVVVLAFLDPDCTDICPLTSQILMGAMRRLGPAASEVEMLGVNVNPAATRARDLAAYTRVHGMNALGRRWRFLTGTPKQLRQVWKAYGVYVATPHGEVVHQAAVELVDESGYLRSAFETPMRYDSIPRESAMLAAGIAKLLPGDPAMHLPPGPAYPPAWAPARLEQVALAGPRPGRVELGAGHPHLVCFFADWQKSGTNLPARLAVLDAYGAAARRHGWPPPLAIDEMTTEPSRMAARRGLKQLGRRLRTPIISDNTGRIADGYAVEDLPWYALTSPQGKILWRHDGWLSAKALIRQAGAAWGKRAGR